MHRVNAIVSHGMLFHIWVSIWQRNPCETSSYFFLFLSSLRASRPWMNLYPIVLVGTQDRNSSEWIETLKTVRKEFLHRSKSTFKWGDHFKELEKAETFLTYARLIPVASANEGIFQHSGQRCTWCKFARRRDYILPDFAISVGMAQYHNVLE